MKNKLHSLDRELFCWVGALLFIFFSDPNASHFSLCLFKYAGFNYCPGCGIGHAITFLLHGELIKSLNAHPLGIFALIIILFRIYQLININLKPLKTNYK